MFDQKNSRKLFWGKIWALIVAIGVIFGILGTNVFDVKDKMGAWVQDYFGNFPNHSEDPSVACLANTKPGFLTVDPNVPLSHKEWIGDTPTKLSEPFQIQIRPVTISEFKIYVASKPRQSFPDSLEGSTWRIGSDHDPANDIPWIVAQDYGKWITETVNDGCRYRLPTRDEWRQAVAALARSDDDPERDLFYGEFQWGMLEWTQDPCENGGRISVGSEWRKDNENDGKKSLVPAATCLAPHHVKNGFLKQGFRLVRVPKIIK